MFVWGLANCRQGCLVRLMATALRVEGQTVDPDLSLCVAHVRHSFPLFTGIAYKYDTGNFSRLCCPERPSTTAGAARTQSHLRTPCTQRVRTGISCCHTQKWHSQAASQAKTAAATAAERTAAEEEGRRRQEPAAAQSCIRRAQRSDGGHADAR